jgi:hypothetical protein
MELLSLHGDILTKIFVTIHSGGKSDSNINKLISMDVKFTDSVGLSISQQKSYCVCLFHYNYMIINNFNIFADLYHDFTVFDY